MNGVELKQFINRVLGIPKVNLRAKGGKHWCSVQISTETGEGHRFPDEFGSRCMRIVYKGQPFQHQSWGGHVQRTSISMFHDQWEGLMAQYTPTEPTPQGREGGQS